MIYYTIVKLQNTGIRIYTNNRLQKSQNIKITKKTNEGGKKMKIIKKYRLIEDRKCQW